MEAFFFGGETTFGELGDKEKGNYLVHSRKFPQQTALLGMIRKELLIQAGLLTKKRNGEWIDNHRKNEAKELIGDAKVFFNKEQTFGVLKRISSVFLMKDNQKFIKKVDIDSCRYERGLLKDYNPKEDIYDNFVSFDHSEKLKSSDIFKEVEQVGIKKDGKNNAFFKKTSYLLKKDFVFAFYIEMDFELKSSLVILGAEMSTFKMEVSKSDGDLEQYKDKKGYLTLLSDSYISVDIKKYAEFAITSEISFRYLKNDFNGNKRTFSKSENIFLYEKGSVFIEPKSELIHDLDNKNLQKIGYNIYSIGEK